MRIYSFEFGDKPITWYRNEFKEMIFLGTESRRFPQNRNFIRFDENLFTSDIDIKPGSHYKPIIDIPDKNIIVHMNSKSGDTSIDLYNGEMQEDFDIAIITIDKSHYRMIDWCLIDSNHEIIKTKDTEYNDIAVVKLNDTGSKMEMVMIFYNKLLKRYEYFEIRYKKDENGVRGLICRNRTEAVGRAIMQEWKEYDLENSSKVLKWHTPFTYSINSGIFTNYIICNPDDKEVLYDLIPEWVEIVTIDELSENKFINGTKALTIYNIDVFSDEAAAVIEKVGIRYIFIMDETGKITT